MKIHLEYTAVLDVKGVRNGMALEIPDGSTVAALLNRLEVRPEHQKFVVPFINGAQKKLSAQLRDNDKVVLSLPVGGG